MLRSALFLLILAACTPDSVGSTSEVDPSTGVDSTSSGGTTAIGSSGERETDATGSSGTSSTAESTGTGNTAHGATSDTGDASTSGVTTSGTTSEDSIGGTGSSTGDGEPLCWAKGCDADHPCAPGLECELHPNAVGLMVCSAPCESCATGLFFCDAAVPIGECLPGAGDMPRCFPILCPNGQGDCKGGQECIDGACFG